MLWLYYISFQSGDLADILDHNLNVLNIFLLITQIYL